MTCPLHLHYNWTSASKLSKITANMLRVSILWKWFHVREIQRAKHSLPWVIDNP
jgi:hypothetical protein